MDIHNSIMDIHNYRVYAHLSFHMSQLIHIKKYLFKIWLGISDHLEIRVHSLLYFCRLRKMDTDLMAHV